MVVAAQVMTAMHVHSTLLCSYRRDPRLAETFNDFEASVQWFAQY